MYYSSLVSFTSMIHILDGNEKRKKIKKEEKKEKEKEKEKEKNKKVMKKKTQISSREYDDATQLLGSRLYHVVSIRAIKF